MKKIKRILSLLLCAAMLLSAAPVPAGAADGPTIRIGSQTARPGYYISIPVSAEDLENIAALDLEIFYDSSLLIYQGYSSGLFSEASVSVNAASAGKITISSAAPYGISGSGTLLWLDFIVASDSGSGNCPLQVAVGDAYDTGLSPVILTGVDGSVSISAASSSVQSFYTYCYTDKSTLQAGDTVTLTLCNGYYYGLASGIIEINYDSSLFQLENAALSSSLSSSTLSSVNTDRAGIIKASFASSDTTGSDVYAYEMMTVTLTAIADVDQNSYITCSVSDLYTADLVAYQPSTCSCTLRLSKLPTQAASYQLSINSEKQIVGLESVTTLVLEAGAGVGAGDFTVHYDPTVFECVDVSPSQALSSKDGIVYIDPEFTKGTVRFSYLNESGNADEIHLVDLTFKPLRSPGTHYQLTASGSGIVSAQLDENDAYIPVSLEFVCGTGCIYTGLGQAPTCTTGGSITYTCAACTSSYYESSAEALGHSMTYHPAVSATCTDTGTVAYWSCSRCSQNFTSETGGTVLTDLTIPKNPDNHTGNTELKNQKDATCTDEGYTGDTCCTACTNVITPGQIIPAFVHDFSIQGETTAPTCTEEGSTLYRCSRCTETELRDIQPATGHSYGAVQFQWAEDHNSCSAIRICGTDPSHVERTACIVRYETTDATCTIPGNITYTASVVLDTVTHSDTQFVTDQSLGHSMTYHSPVTATCTKKGSIEYWSCSRCILNFADSDGNSLAPELTVPVDPGNHSGGTYLQGQKDATCTGEGYTGDTYCTGCASKIASGKIVSPSGHSMTYHSPVTATCIKKGSIEYWSCSRCTLNFADSDGNSLASELTVPVDPGNHSGGTYLQGQKDATCTGEGYTGDTYCTGCASKIASGSTIAIKDHTATVLKAVAATCTQTGLTEGSRCAVCSTVLTAQQSIPATGHSFGPWTVVTAATGASEGLQERECSICTEKEQETIEKLSHPFEDVLPGKFYEAPVLWAVENEITNGTTATTFAPNDNCTRGQVVTFLWRAAGSPEPTSTSNPFVDVAEGKFFYKAVLWAVEEGITNGVDSTHFGPNEKCTRGHVATFLWRTLNKPAASSTSNPFNDVISGKFYYDAVLWAADTGVTTGTAPGKFEPNSTCTRGQIVTFLYRALGVN